MNINTKYKIYDHVYLITDVEQLPRLITGIMIRPIGLMFHLSCGDTETVHYAQEFSKDKIIF